MSSTSNFFQNFLQFRGYLVTLFSAKAYYHAVELSFLALVIYLALTRAYKPWKERGTSTTQLTQQEINQKISQWIPKPLADPLPKSIIDSLPLDINIHHINHQNQTLTINNQTNVINFSTNNFLGLLNHQQINDACLNTMKNYGLGACGPRGFYGTTDIHLECEDKLATFSNTKSAILYSFGSATSNSAIPAFCKRGDIIIIDEKINFILQSGVNLSRAQVISFRHNDMQDLESILRQITDDDIKNPNLCRTQRRLILVEAIYQNIGDLCPLDEIVRLKEKYLFRLMLDESYSIGVLGNTGHGALEHFNISRHLIDIATADLGNAIASVGGFCVGSDDVVSHQRLSGAGYCFSASQPPFLATAATKALDIINQKGASLISKLRSNITIFRQHLDINSLLQKGWYVDGHTQSPIIHIRNYDDTLSHSIFTNLQKLCLEKDILIAKPVYTLVEINPPKPSLKISISAAHSATQLEYAAKTLKQILLNY